MSTVPVLAYPCFAFGHPGHDLMPISGHFLGSLLQGFLHPLLGVDHLLTAIAVGLWAAVLGNRAVWSLPFTFVLSSLVGGYFGIRFGVLSFGELGIIASLLFLGCALLRRLRIPLWISLSLIALFGI